MNKTTASTSGFADEAASETVVEKSREMDVSAIPLSGATTAVEPEKEGSQDRDRRWVQPRGIGTPVRFRAIRCGAIPAVLGRYGARSQRGSQNEAASAKRPTCLDPDRPEATRSASSRSMRATIRGLVATLCFAAGGSSPRHQENLRFFTDHSG